LSFFKIYKTPKSGCFGTLFERILFFINHKNNTKNNVSKIFLIYACPQNFSLEQTHFWEGTLSFCFAYEKNIYFGVNHDFRHVLLGETF